MAIDRSALAHAIAGASASALAVALFFPLDQLRVHEQLNPEQQSPRQRFNILRALRLRLQAVGLAGLYQGLPSSLAAIVWANFVYFFVYNALKGKAVLTGPRSVLVPALAGVINVLASSPIFVVSTRLRAASPGQYRDAMACVREILAEGPASLWSGLAPSLWLVSNPTVQHFSYERLKLLAQARTSLQFFIAGAVSKAVATMATYPLQVAQTLLRTQRGEQAASRGGEGNTGPVYRGVLDCLRRLLAEEGVAGLYRGVDKKLTHTVLTAALMFAIYERIVSRVLRLLGVQRLTAAKGLN